LNWSLNTNSRPPIPLLRLMAQWKTCVRLKIRRIPVGHSSPFDHYAKSKQTQQPHNLKNMNLASSTQKYMPLFLLLSQFHIVSPSRHPPTPLKQQDQSSPRIITHIHHNDCQVSSKDSAPSLKLAH
jgi:hypothetical protein